MQERNYVNSHCRYCPTEVKKYRFDAPTIAKLLEKQWWHAPAEEIDKVKEMEFRVAAYINT